LARRQKFPLIGQHLSINHTSEQVESEVAPFHLEVAKKGEHQGEVGHRRKDGMTFPTWMSTTALKDDQGKQVGFVGIARDITERKQAEEAVRESEDRYRSLVEESPDVIGIYQEGKLIFINSTGVQLLGAKARAELVGQTGEQLIHSEDYPASTDRIRRRLAGETGLYPAEVRYLRVDGTAVPMEVSATPITFGGKPAVQFIARDITERKRAERQLAQSELRLRLVWEHALVPMRLADAMGRVVLVNDAYCRFAGKPREELEGQPVAVAYEPARHDQIQRDYVARYRQGGDVWHREVEVTLWNGKHASVEVTESFFDLPDQPGLLLTTLRDITERKQAEERIRAQAELLDLAQDAIAVRDMNGCVQYWNKGCERLTGWTAAEALGKSMSELVKPDPAEFDRARRVLLEAGHWSGEQTIVTKDGRAVTNMSRWTLVRDAQGQPKSTLIINTDITEKKKLEAQFLRAQRLESVGRLASGIAHDLNNILAPVLMAPAMIRDSTQDPDVHKMLDLIEANAQRGAGIIRQLLTFGRGTEGQRIPLPLRHLVKEMDSIIAETFPKNIKLLRQSPADVWLVNGDPTQLHQVLLNLCVNARDAMPYGGTLTLGLENMEVDEFFARSNAGARPGPHVALSVTDTGTGIAPENLDTIFDPFFTTKELGQGTGLGLSTVLGIVKGHGGFIQVNSRVGHGTQFTVYLPASPEAVPAPRPADAAPLPQGHGELVLVVDDEENIRLAARRILERAGYRVLEAKDGADGLAQYTRQPEAIQVIVTDLMMPFADGPSLIRAVLGWNAQTRFIVMSGLKPDWSAVPRDAVEAVLPKPFTAADLLHAVHRALHPATPPKV
jgi:PAS domain S-box-containing protein